MRRVATMPVRRLLRRDALAVDDPRDEATLMNVTAGTLWMIAAAAGLIGLALPGSDHEHLAVAIPLFAAVIVFGALEVLLIYPRPTATLTQHAIVTASTM